MAAALAPGHVLLSAAGCKSPREKGAASASASPQPEQLDHGYALLHGLLEKQQHVSKILWAKFESDQLEALIEDIARACDEAHERLEQLAKVPPAIAFTETGLPEVEVQTRDAIESTTTEELLGSSGRPFEARLLLTQLKSLRYASHLARVLGEKDSATERVEFLGEFDARSESLRRRALELLAGGLPFEIEGS